MSLLQLLLLAALCCALGSFFAFTCLGDNLGETGLDSDSAHRDQRILFLVALFGALCAVLLCAAIVVWFVRWVA